MADVEVTVEADASDTEQGKRVDTIDQHRKMLKGHNTQHSGHTGQKCYN